ncbi:MAG TPA: hypothetical protein VGR37_09965 [Longimicrobiaceae bacterium]|nr:hypothetical protein [Longimicrobiaceae bacterium]
MPPLRGISGLLQLEALRAHLGYPRVHQGRLDAPDYQAALREFNSRYVWLRPVQVDVDSPAVTMNMVDSGQR